MTTCNQAFLCFLFKFYFLQFYMLCIVKCLALITVEQPFKLLFCLLYWSSLRVHTVEQWSSVQLCIDPRELFLTFVWLHDRATTQPLAVIYYFAIHLPGWAEMIMKISESESGDRMVSFTPSSVIVKK